MNGSNVISTSYDSIINLKLLQKQSYKFVQVQGTEDRLYNGSIQNINEAKVVLKLLCDLRSTLPRLARDPHWCSIKKIRVITFYQAQVELIARMLSENGLQNIAVSSVDSSQGSEADLIVISFVRTGRMGSIGFLSDDRRLNVALTRAKFKLVCVGDFSQLATTQGKGAYTIRSLIQDAVDRDKIDSDYSANTKYLLHRQKKRNNSINHGNKKGNKRQRKS